MIPQIIFDACGTSKGTRHDLTSPFPWGDWIYGTDGRIMVRCPIRCDLDLKLAEGRKVPDPARITDVRIERITVELPEATEATTCEWCNGTGKTDRYQCDNCGDTQQVMHRGKPIEFDCPDCDGKGTVRSTATVKVSDSPRLYLAARYVGLLRRHGVRHVDIPTGPQGDKIDDPSCLCAFSGDGFEGWLMPMHTARVEADMGRDGKLAAKGG